MSFELCRQPRAPLEHSAPRGEIRRVHRAFAFPFLLLVSACTSRSDQAVYGGRDTLVVFEASSLSGAMLVALDSFSRRSDPSAVVMEEHGASLELARRITELGRVPDVIALADQEVFPQLLVPGATRWYAAFARNRMVVAYTARSRHAAEITPSNWRSVLLRADVLVGRTDPVLAPAGYRALLLYKLAESFYRDPGLATRLEARTPPRLMRGNASELAALLSAGELDYIIEYESLARAQELRFIPLPAEIDLGDARLADAYAAASVRIARGKDTVEIHGAPILYGISVPTNAPHAAVGHRFLRFLFGPAGLAILRASNVDALDTLVLHGDSVPAAIHPVTPK